MRKHIQTPTAMPVPITMFGIDTKSSPIPRSAPCMTQEARRVFQSLEAWVVWIPRYDRFLPDFKPVFISYLFRIFSVNYSVAAEDSLVVHLDSPALAKERTSCIVYLFP